LAAEPVMQRVECRFKLIRVTHGPGAEWRRSPMATTDILRPDRPLQIRNLSFARSTPRCILSTSQGGEDVEKRAVRKLFNTRVETGSKVRRAPSAVEVGPGAIGGSPEVAPKPRQVHKAGEVNISAYFLAEVKASLRMVQAKTRYNVKDCLAEARHDLFRKHNVPVSVDLGGGH